MFEDCGIISVPPDDGINIHIKASDEVDKCYPVMAVRVRFSGIFHVMLDSLPVYKITLHSWENQKLMIPQTE